MNTHINKITLKQRINTYKRSKLSLLLFLLVAISTLLTVAVLGFLLMYILIKGVPNLNLNLFAIKYTSDNVSMLPAIINTLTMTAVSLAIAVPIGIFSAIYMTEYAKRGNRLVKIVKIAAETLTGIPSIVYGLFGMIFFLGTLKLGYSILSGALTLSIMILPVVMRTTQEALLSVSDSFREGSLALGAGKLRTVFRIVLPSAMPGILSGIILATGRIVGETAALMYTAGSVTNIASNLMDSGRTLAVHMYLLSNEGLHVDQAYATAVVLLVVVIVINWISSRIARSLSGNKN